MEPCDQSSCGRSGFTHDVIQIISRFAGTSTEVGRQHLDHRVDDILDI